MEGILEGASKTWGLDGQSGFERCILHNPTQRKYLRFVESGNTYEINCLPFGLSSVPWVFTKTLKPVAALLREMGVRLIVYILTN